MSKHTIFDICHARVNTVLDRMARHHARGDKALADDLRQEGRIAIWLLVCDRWDTSTVRARTLHTERHAAYERWREESDKDRTPDNGLLIRCISCRMRNFMRRKASDRSAWIRVIGAPDHCQTTYPGDHMMAA